VGVCSCEACHALCGDCHRRTMAGSIRPIHNADFYYRIGGRNLRGNRLDEKIVSRFGKSKNRHRGDFLVELKKYQYQKMENCVFCNRELDKGETLYETPNFFVKTGLGLAAPGHVMLISKEHYVCYADMPAGLRGDFCELKDFVFGKIGQVFGAPFLVEYGPMVQTVSHAHLHFIPKQRKETEYYPGYAIKNIFKEMEIPTSLIEQVATWEKAAQFRKKFGQYVYLQEGQECVLFGSPDTALLKELGYRRFFSEKLKIMDIPAKWQDITNQERAIDAAKKEITKTLLKF